MPCIKCSNGKWRYGQHGRCQFDTYEACAKAAAVIHIPPKDRLPRNKEAHPIGCECPTCSGYYKDCCQD